uniref:Pheromone biosynthesis activating neuropeptide n=1 Tax=Pieris rapae TaxID=64459 RepID=A0A5B8AFV0_PIERA|nr:pheromone biosynthesis activating neuropeptide [Pieris rapae]QDA95094.1 pheromone biosynthesis activating neuropeptide [Pieris rapae]QDA95095.1 pheromone biosynthesis activating neuropeptide [Pieris rapae]QDA95107.1 pheromone biosynthesis activating neuropeptide [Pieris rapae]QDA95108.1 pheromone biosynthesis activating neuropeptide [Pieris rapae]
MALDRIMFTVLLFVAYNMVLVCGVNSKDDIQDRGAHSDRGGVWFGPRLGKRSMRLGDDSKATLLRLLESADNLRYYYDQLPYEMQSDVGQDKIIFTPKLGRAIEERLLNDVEFTPRLGRRKIDQALPTVTDEESYRQDQMVMNTRPNHFSPRLGRNYNFSPRLGRELTYDLYPSVRVSRSVNNSKAN